MLIRRVAALAALNSARVDALASFDLAATLDVVSIAQLATIRSLGHEIVPRLPNLNLASGLALATLVLATLLALRALASPWPLGWRGIGHRRTL